MNRVKRLAFVLLLAIGLGPAAGQAADPVGKPTRLAEATLRSITLTPDYLDLLTLYNRRSRQGGSAWTDSAQGRRMAATLAAMRATAASVNTVDPDGSENRVVNYRLPGRRPVKLTSIVPPTAESDQATINDLSDMLVRFMLDDMWTWGLLPPPLQPLEPAEQALLNDGIKAAGQRDYLAAIDHFWRLTKRPRASAGKWSGRVQREIFYNLGLAESKVPGRELRAVAWFGAYLTADPYTAAANQTNVLKLMAGILATDQDNGVAYLKALDDGAGDKFGGLKAGDFLFKLAWQAALAGDIGRAQRTLARIPASDAYGIGAYAEVVTAQLAAGDIQGALKTAGLIQDRYADAPARPPDDRPQSTYLGAKTEAARVLAKAQTAIAHAQFRAGDRAGGQKSLAAAQANAALIGYAYYASLARIAIAEVLLDIGDRDAAKAAIMAARTVVDRIGEDASSTPYALLQLGRVEVLIGDIDGAVQSFRRVLNDPYPLEHRYSEIGAALARGGDVDGALAMLEKARDTMGGPTFLGGTDIALVAIVEAMAKAGQFDHARELAGEIEDEHSKSRALLSVAQAEGSHGTYLSDWLEILYDDDIRHPLALNSEAFTDVAGYMKFIQSAKVGYFAELELGFASQKTRARDLVRSMVANLAKN